MAFSLFCGIVEYELAAPLVQNVRMSSCIVVAAFCGNLVDHSNRDDLLCVLF